MTKAVMFRDVPYRGRFWHRNTAFVKIGDVMAEFIPSRNQQRFKASDLVEVRVSEVAKEEAA